MTSINELVAPGRVALDDLGDSLFAEMMTQEQRFISSLRLAGCKVWRQRTDKSFSSERGIPGLRRWVVLVHQAEEEKIRSLWTRRIRDLEPSRDALFAHVQQLAVAQGIDRPGAGGQSTSLPNWIGQGERVCDRVTYTLTHAFRAGEISDSEILPLLERRLANVEKYIENARAAHKPSRIPPNEERRKELSAAIATVVMLRASHGRLVARASSGEGTRVRFRWDGGGSQQVTVQHVVAATVTPDCKFERAPTRDRGSKYGEPLAELLGGALYVYADPRFCNPDPLSTSS